MKSSIPVVILLLLLLSSCAQQLQHERENKVLLKQQSELSKIPENWELKGRISIIDKQTNWHARFHWKKQTNQFQLRFTGPMGGTYLLLEQKSLPDMKVINTLRIGNDVYISVGSLEKLLAQHSDIAIPVNSLQYWIFGRLNPQHPYQIKMSSVDKPVDEIAELFQQNWKIQFSRYKLQQDVSYPAKIIAKNNEYSIKVFVSSRQVYN